MATKVIILLILSASSAFGYVVDYANKIVTTDGSYADVSLATFFLPGQGDGWIINVGQAGGVYTWGQELDWGMANNVTIQGPDPSNPTTIVFNHSDRYGAYFHPFQSANPSAFCTWKNFVFTNGPGVGPTFAEIGLTGEGVCFRISNCSFQTASPSTWCLGIGQINSLHYPGPWGLIDHCNFELPDTPRPYNVINVRANGNVDNWVWTQQTDVASTNAVVVEYCNFSQPHILPLGAMAEADGGAEIVIRYCNITNLPGSFHGIRSGANCSTKWLEFYGNNWVFNANSGTPVTVAYMLLQRGGSGVLFSNAISAGPNTIIGELYSYWVECASSQWAAEHCTSQLQYPVDYPANEQIGRGVLANGTQVTKPVYIWSQISQPPSTYGIVLGYDLDSAFIVQGRDIFTNSPMPGYVPMGPHPLDTGTNNPPPPTPPVQAALLTPLGRIAAQNNLH